MPRRAVPRVKDLLKQAKVIDKLMLDKTPALEDREKLLRVTLTSSRFRKAYVKDAVVASMRRMSAKNLRQTFSAPSVLFMLDMLPPRSLNLSKEDFVDLIRAAKNDQLDVFATFAKHQDKLRS